ncbi:MAG: hemerythrin domain-containing protein [Planctomycetota bacterium]|jgi:hemerythrin
MNSDMLESNGYEQVLQQHRTLMALLAQLEQKLRQDDASVAEVSYLLGQLGDQLIKHFAMEEEGGYFSDALHQAPRLISHANELMAQHPKMTSAAQQLAEHLETAQAAADWREETWKRFEVFRIELVLHERREDSLLLEAYHRDIGTSD